MTSTQIRIKKVTLVFRLLFQFLMVAVPIVYILAWINVPQPIDVSGKAGFFVSMIPRGIEILHPLSISTKIYGFLVSVIPMMIIESILYFLVRLFKLYEQAEIFSIKNVNYIKKIGYSLLIFTIAQILCNGFLSAILTWNNPHGHRVAVLTVSGTSIVTILTAFLIVLVSWIMSEGCRLREEQQLTI